MIKLRYTLLILALSFVPFLAKAQKTAVAINAGDIACLGTINGEVSYAVAQKFTLNASARVNPWTYFKGDEERQTQLRHQTYAIGARFWPWYVYSGFWFGAKAQYQEYNYGGFRGKLKTEEGDAFGLGVELGYCLMLSHHWNLNFGFGGWGGVKKYTQYACPYCGRKTAEGTTGFFLPNELIISVLYVF